MSLTPTSRREQYYDAIANGSTDVPDPISREEKYLKQIAENGGGGGETSQPNITVSGTSSNNDTPSSSDIANATFAYNSTIAEMVDKIETKGTVDVAGVLTYTDGMSIEHYIPLTAENHQCGIVPYAVASQFMADIDEDTPAIELTVSGATLAAQNASYNFYLYQSEGQIKKFAP